MSGATASIPRTRRGWSAAAAAAVSRGTAVIEARLGGWRLPAAVFVAVLVAGQLAVGMQASAVAPFNGDEPFYVISAQSLVSDGDLDLRDEYGTLEYWAWWQGTVPLWRQMTPAPDGRLISPHEPGLALLITPAFAVAGVEGIQRFLVVVWAAAVACGSSLARRYGSRALAALAGGVVVGAGAPGLVYASQIYPEGPAALAVAIALLLCTGARPRPLLLALTLVALAWLGVKYVAFGGLLGSVWAWRFRDHRRALAMAAAICAAAAAHYVWWHLDTFGGLTPYSVNAVWSGQPDDVILTDHFDLTWRTYRLYGLFLDARFGLFRWLPVAIVGVWGLWRGSGEFATLPGATFAVGVLVGTFASITIMGWWFPGRLLVAGFPALVVLVALGAQRIPWTAVLLGLWSLAVAGSLAWAARHGVVYLAVEPFNLGPPLPPAWAFPDFRRFGAAEIARSLAWGGVLFVAATRPAWRGRLPGRSAVPT